MNEFKALIAVFRRYLVTFWIGLVVYSVTVFWALILLAQELSRTGRITSRACFLVGVVIGAFFVVRLIFSDLRYWRSDNGDDPLPGANSGGRRDA